MKTVYDCSVASWNHRLHGYAGLSNALREGSCNDLQILETQFLDHLLGIAPV